MDQLSQFIQDNPDPRELKRALAVQMVRQDYRHRESQQILHPLALSVSGLRHMSSKVFKVCGCGTKAALGILMPGNGKPY